MRTKAPPTVVELEARRRVVSDLLAVSRPYFERYTNDTQELWRSTHRLTMSVARKSRPRQARRLKDTVAAREARADAYRQLGENLYELYGRVRETITRYEGSLTPSQRSRLLRVKLAFGEIARERQGEPSSKNIGEVLQAISGVATSALLHGALETGLLGVSLRDLVAAALFVKWCRDPAAWTTPLDNVAHEAVTASQHFVAALNAEKKKPTSIGEIARDIFGIAGLSKPYPPPRPEPMVAR